MKKILMGLVLLVLILGGVWFWQTQGRKGGEKEKVKIKMQNAKILMIVAPTNFRDEEFLKPKEVFEKNGFSVTVASKGVKEATGMLGARAKVEIDLSQVKVADYEAIVFVGGSGASVYFDDQTALNLAKEAYNQGKIVAAICIAPSILANAGLLEEKRATAFPSEAENLRSKGAEYTGEEVTVAGKIITASGPQAAKEFGEEIVDLLK